jgi:F-type H+-transporting ATPase subunit alpha
MFDTVSVSKIKDAQTALMTRLWSEYKDDMRELNKGGKPTEDLDKIIEKVALSVAKGFEG